MANWNDPNMAASGFGAGANAMDQAVDAGLRSYMLSVYNYMGSGVLLTGIVAMLAFQSGFTASMVGTPLMWVVMLAPLAFVLVLSFGINKLSTTAAQVLFWVYAAVMGLSMSMIFLAFTSTSIAQTFFATAAAFLGLPLFVLYITAFQIQPEERVLSAQFGAPYLQYLQQVRRWI